ncbi:hypothetical protein C6P45_004917 [Maudiozyma exigua]|uniref:Uncharacterized protein n=1 Tax=Maudiozyma exigua TaxID=34358 RepID=A0A9P6WC12_MAUEX|nr:hypothetical protein C6P45_004917 [Kazachstania exigua]
MDLQDMFTEVGENSKEQMTTPNKNNILDSYTDNFLLIDKNSDGDELLDGMIEELDFSKWLNDDEAISRSPETSGSNPIIHESLDVQDVAPDKKVTNNNKKKTVIYNNSAHSNSTNKLVHKERFTLKRTKSNPFYSPSQQIKNLVMKKKMNSNKITLQKSYSTDVLPLNERNINVKISISELSQNNTIDN